MRKPVAESGDGVRWYAGEHVVEPSKRLDPAPLELAMKLHKTAAVLPPLSLPKNVQLLRLCALVHNRNWTKPLRGIRVAPAFQRKEPALTNPSPAFL